MLKTYSGDINYVARLIPSFHLHNSDGLTLYLVAPRSEAALFTRFQSSTVVLVPDEEIPTSYAKLGEVSEEVRGILNAGVAKLAFFKLDLAKNYFAIDSDMVFIRDFYSSDFLDPSGVPYFIQTQGLAQKIDPFYYERYWKHRSDALKAVAGVLQTSNPIEVCPHNSQIMSSTILSSLETEFLRVKGLDFKNLMHTALYEFFWYSTWALKQTRVATVPRDELVFMVHHQGEHLSLYNRGIRTRDLARGYLGVIVNSNWSRQYGIVDFDFPSVESYSSTGTWAEWEKGRES